MYFCSILLLISYILILVTVHTHTQNAKGPGISACFYIGDVGMVCDIPDVSISCLPEACTSIIYFGIIVDSNNQIYVNPYMCEMNKIYLDYLNKTLQSGKPTFVYYGHNTQEEWAQVLCGDASDGEKKTLDEMKSLEAFMKEYPGITGLILINLQNDVMSTECSGCSENLKKYLEVMKTTFPKLEIGIEMLGKCIIDQMASPTKPWLDFKVIDCNVDFYVVDVGSMNVCTEDLKFLGVSPMISITTNYTMENVKCALTQASIPKEKTYFKFDLNTTPNPDDSNTMCKSTIQEICLNSTDTSGWCSDTVVSLNEKGKFSKENGVGFLTAFMELNDPTNICECEKPFGSFYALLDGFNGVTSKPCLLFERK